MICNNDDREMVSIRKDKIELGKQLEYDHYRYMGPDDHETTQICADALDVITTLKEWEKLSPDITTQGLHKGCRHELYPVLLANPEPYQKRLVT